MEVRTRIAPSPTGDPHVGTAYIALFNLVFARHFGGKFILRIEDTDRTRSLTSYEENIYKALSWLNIEWDEGPDKGGEFGPYRQSERLSIYEKYAQILLEKKLAYKCFATKEELLQMREMAAKMGKKQGYDRRYRNLSDEEIRKREEEKQAYVIRMKIPLQGECSFDDAIKGKITCPWADVDDQIIMKSDGYPTYHFAAVVDDYLMKITHVIRGDEWISSTPKHIFLYEAFGWEKPIYYHMPLLLGQDGKKLSKRKNPTSIFFYKDSGYLPSAMINFLSLMGYSMPNEKEIYSLNELTSGFEPKHFGKSGAFFDIKKLDWLNQQYIINNVNEDSLLDKLKEWQFNDHFMQKLMPLVHTRMKTFGDFIDLCQFFFTNNLNLSLDLFNIKKLSHIEICYIMQCILWSLEEQNSFGKEALEKASHTIATIFDISHKKVIMPILFIAITGKRQGPPLFASVDILGKERTRARFLEAISFLGGISNKKMAILKKCWDKKDCHELIEKKE